MKEANCAHIHTEKARIAPKSAPATTCFKELLAHDAVHWCSRERHEGIKDRPSLRPLLGPE